MNIENYLITPTILLNNFTVCVFDRNVKVKIFSIFKKSVIETINQKYGAFIIRVLGCIKFSKVGKHFASLSRIVNSDKVVQFTATCRCGKQE